MQPASPVLVAGRYRLDQLLSADEGGELWRGADVELSRPVVVRLGDRELAGDEAALERFRSEACSLGSLMHRGIPRIFDYGEPASVPAADRPFLVMEYVDGPSLAELLSRGPLEAGRTLDVSAQIAAALATAHEAGFVHAEISPRKIRLDRDSGAKLLECGNAYQPASENAPDRIAADLYALGIVAYQCLGGLEPAGGAALRPLPASVPAGVRELVAELTAEDPARRPGSAADVADRAEALRKQLRKLPEPGRGTGASTAQPRASLTANPMAPADPATQPLDAVASKRRPSIPVRTAAVAGIVLLAMGAYGAFGPHPAPPPVAVAQPKPAVVEVLASKLIGLPVQVACARLHRLGLRTAVEWKPTDAVPPGRVTSLRPLGPVLVGHLVTVIGSSSPASASKGARSGAHAHKKAQAPRPRRTRPATTPSAGPSPSPSATSPGPSPTASPSPTGTPSPAATSPAPPATPRGGWLAGLVLADWAAWL